MNLRQHFEADRFHIAHAAITVLAAEGKMTATDVVRAIKQYRIDSDKPNPITLQGSGFEPPLPLVGRKGMLASHWLACR